MIKSTHTTATLASAADAATGVATLTPVRDAVNALAYQLGAHDGDQDAARALWAALNALDAAAATLAHATSKLARTARGGAA